MADIQQKTAATKKWQSVAFMEGEAELLYLLAIQEKMKKKKDQVKTHQ